MSNQPIFMLISAQFYMFIITMVIFIVYFLINFYFRLNRKKKAYFLLTEGYEIVSYDKYGIPTFMKKGENIEKL